MQLIDCDESYSAQILDILNDCIVNSTALYDYKPRSMQNMESWFNGGLRVTLKDGKQIEISRRQAAKLKDKMSL